eukprot:TRINITY_DN76852_c0_g1_i1.p1 TRINITY_DN76852_c0_g1~~TRINITY_DN76852_c0_g1_i1.p1  ORF type:complete len:338 (+),score=53.94 TRINITY_DN76852_c0_g1_i1:42-1016(+)
MASARFGWRQRGLAIRKRPAWRMAWAAAGMVVWGLCRGPTLQPAFGPAAPPTKEEPDEARRTNDREHVQLFGREAWRIGLWRAETDDVRGGSSTATFKGLTDTSGFAEFCGTLDRAKLDSAFAGVSFKTAEISEDLAETKGLVLDIARADGKQYSVGLRMLGAPAGVQHKFRFTANMEGPKEMYFRDFKPMLNGKVACGIDLSLHLERVESITLQIEGDGSSQEGAFALVLRSILAIAGRELPPPPPPARETKWVCEACGTSNFDFSKACTRCGEGRNAKEEKALIAAKEWAKKQVVKWECDECGRMNFPGTSECFKCGSPKSR